MKNGRSKLARLRDGKVILFIMAGLCLSACNGKSASGAKKQPARELGTLTAVASPSPHAQNVPTTSSASASLQTTSTAAPVDKAEMKFFTEQYLPTNERLQRRQARLKEALNSATAQ